MQSNAFLKPRIIDVQSTSPFHAKVVMEPFERGYGHTLGNALRRVLLSSMVGYAPTEVTIAGVLHEYSAIDGVQEDVVHIMLNLKGVVFRLHNRDEVTLVLRKEGEGPVTAGDIQTPHDVEIINPEHVIANLSSGGKLDMQIKVEQGRSYVPGNLRRYDLVARHFGLTLAPARAADALRPMPATTAATDPVGGRAGPPRHQPAGGGGSKALATVGPIQRRHRRTIEQRPFQGAAGQGGPGRGQRRARSEWPSPSDAWRFWRAVGLRGSRRR